ncbi:hypothetical protein FRB94_009526 [Tulasnella sp. JGI-2019a]|nr:hypothetical protein FRB94_009526 [Tulasnella sp. JGI-2019a]
MPRKHKDKKQPQIPPGGYVDAANNRQQKANRAGLLVTDELQKAIDRCKEKVERLADECLKGNRKFRDIEFDIIEDRDRCLYALDTTGKPKYAPADVRRIADIFENPQFFVDGATASDIAQGVLGDCWFLSALAVVGTRGLIEKICVARNEKVGIYGFIFQRDSGWVDVIVDDLLFTEVPRWETLSPREQMLYHSDKKKYDRTARKGSKNLLFAKSRTENETWVPLIEKAYAKLHGDYASLEGGYTNEGVEDLTGAVSTIMYVQDLLDTDQYWKDELMRVGVDRLFACFIPIDGPTADDTSGDPPTGVLQSNGIMTNHAYGIIKAVEFREMRFLRIRNPWGQGEWNGAWSDGSKEWNVEWGTELLKALDYQFGDDGEFIMEYSDFLETWGIIERSRLFDEDWVMSSQWLTVTTGSYLNAWNYGDVSYSIKVDKPTPAVIVLAQLDSRYFEEFSGQYFWSLNFTVHARPAPTSDDRKAASPIGEVTAPTQPPVLAESLGSAIYSKLWDRSVKMEVMLPRAGEYVVQVRIDRQVKRAKDYLTTNASGWSGRKYARKYAEYVTSRSIAANFDASSQGSGLTLPAETYTDKTLTELEIEALDQIQTHRAHKLEAFPLKKPEETVNEGKGKATDKATSVGEDTKKPEDSTVDKVDHDTIPPPPEDDKKAADGAGVEKQEGDEKTSDASKDGGAEAGKDEKKGDGDAKSEDDDDDSSYVDTEAGKKEAEKPEQAKHDGYLCNGCRGDCIGTRYHCVDVTCPDFDYCPDCMKKGLHPPDHKFIALTADADDELTRGDAEEDRDEGNQLTIGLRVYTKKDAPTTITGQRRTGNVIRESIVMSKVL